LHRQIERKLYSELVCARKEDGNLVLVNDFPVGGVAQKIGERLLARKEDVLDVVLPQQLQRVLQTHDVEVIGEYAAVFENIDPRVYEDGDLPHVPDQITAPVVVVQYPAVGWDQAQTAQCLNWVFFNDACVQVRIRRRLPGNDRY